MLDLQKSITELRAEKIALTHLIEAAEIYEQVLRGERILGRRGRKTMGATEREAVSRRMKRYWASRRKITKMVNSQPTGSVAEVFRGTN